MGTKATLLRYSDAGNTWMLNLISFESVYDVLKGVYRIRVSSIVFFFHFLMIQPANRQATQRLPSENILRKPELLSAHFLAWALLGAYSRQFSYSTRGHSLVLGGRTSHIASYIGRCEHGPLPAFVPLLEEAVTAQSWTWAILTLDTN